MKQDTRKYLTGPEVERRYSISRMTVYRWQHDEEMGFPKPLVINRRKYWETQTLDEWDAARLQMGAAA